MLLASIRPAKYLVNLVYGALLATSSKKNLTNPIFTSYYFFPHTTTNYGDRSFAVSGPTVWNSLPAALRLDMSLSVFLARLKTFFRTKATTPLTVDMAHLLHRFEFAPYK